MSSNGSLGALLQGVSQQPNAVMAEGTVKEQINFISDVVDGLTSRPSLVNVALMQNSAHIGYKFTDVEIGGTRYLLGFKPGSLVLWDMLGNEQTITEADAGAMAYIGENMRPYVFSTGGGDTLFLSNRDVVVAKSATADTSSALTTSGIVYCLGGLFARKYTVTLRYGDGTIAVGTYTTPTGDNAGDAANTSAAVIIDQLRLSLSAHPSFKPTTGLVVSGRHLRVSYTAGPFTLVVTDDEDDNTIRAFTNRVKDVAHLSETAPHGMLVRVVGNDEGAEDDYFMRFKSDTSTTLAGGFGGSGVWEEWYDVTQVSSLNPSTMPHVIRKTGPSSFSIGRGAWEQRLVGDDTTNKFPDLVGYPIRDIDGFQERLVFVGGPFVCMSRTDKPLSLFKETALAELDTDPISVTMRGVKRLDWIVPFDRDLVLMSDPGAGQYVITGDSKLTPSNAAMVKTTAFEMRGVVKPVETGRTVMFPFKSGKYSGIKEFFTNDQVATNGADTITDAADKYITGLVDHMVCSTNFSMVVLKTDDPARQDTAWVYSYLWSGTDKQQSSLSKWQFPCRVRHFFFSESRLYVLLEEDGAHTGTLNYSIEYMDLDLAEDAGVGYHVCLDRKITVAADHGGGVTLPYSGAVFVQGLGCLYPGKLVLPAYTSASDVDGNVTYSFDDNTVPSGGVLICGVPYERTLVPPNPMARNSYSGKVMPRTRLVVNGYMLHYKDTGYIRWTMASRYRAAPIEYEIDFFGTDDDPNTWFGNGLRSGVMHIPWGERSDWSELTIKSSDARPTTILEIEWTGQYFTGSREG